MTTGFTLFLVVSPTTPDGRFREEYAHRARKNKQIRSLVRGDIFALATINDQDDEVPPMTAKIIFGEDPIELLSGTENVLEMIGKAVNADTSEIVLVANKNDARVIIEKLCEKMFTHSPGKKAVALSCIEGVFDKINKPDIAFRKLYFPSEIEMERQMEISNLSDEGRQIYLN